MPWYKGMPVRRGQLVTSNGGVWRSNAPPPNNIVAANAPSGTANVTGADGIPWIYKRPATVSDTRKVMSSSDDLFDPLGLLTPMGNTIQTAPGKKCLMIQTGQGDASTMASLVTPGEFRDTYISIAKYAISKGIDCVYLGFTCWIDPAQASAGSAVEARYKAFSSAVDDAVAYFGANPKVKPGVNLYRVLGKIPTTTDARIIGLYDGLHMTDAAYEEAGKHWAQVLKG